MFDLDISAVKDPIDFGIANLAQKNLDDQSIIKISTEKDVTNKSLTAPNDAIVHKESDDSQKKEVTQITEALNKFFQTMDAHIRFKIHEKSNQLMVQVVDQQNDKILKEFPPSEFLDTVAAIRDYVGILLDKKI